jgi:hypothetical protein
VKRETREKLASEKAKIERRLEAARHGDGERPSLTTPNIQYEVAEKTSAIAHGGIGAIQLLVKKTGLSERIDQKLHLLKVHAPRSSGGRRSCALVSTCRSTQLMQALRRPPENQAKSTSSQSASKTRCHG